MSNKILILMATYNGERYIDQQLESIAMQTYRDWELWVRDDGSSDDTLSIVHGFAKDYPGQVRIIEDNYNSLGPCRNFAKLMQLAVEESEAEYIALCDQDDVWLAEKLSLELEKLQKLPSDQPKLVFSDLEVVDENGEVLHPSFWEMESYDPVAGVRIPALLSRNVVTGCTILMNRHLLETAVPIPMAAPIHDWWLALVASVFGNIDHVSSSLVRYRQHGHNAIGAKGRGTFVNGLVAFFLHPWKRYSEVTYQHRVQAQQASALLDLIPDKQELHALVSRFSKVRNSNLLQRIRNIDLFSVLGFKMCIARILFP